MLKRPFCIRWSHRKMMMKKKKDGEVLMEKRRRKDWELATDSLNNLWKVMPSMQYNCGRYSWEMRRKFIFRWFLQWLDLLQFHDIARISRQEGVITVIMLTIQPICILNKTESGENKVFIGISDRLSASWVVKEICAS